jgi:hypothetical protein
VSGVDVAVEQAVTLSGRDGGDLGLVVRRALRLVGCGAAGQALPQQQPGQLWMGRVVVESAPGELADVPLEDLVALITFLCSDAASHLSGTVITVRPPVTR